MPSNRFRFPPYSYVPGGPWPHPTGSPDGHLAESPRREPVLTAPEKAVECPEFAEGVALFDDGYYWEAHEVWESIWKALGRRGPTAEAIKGLIKLAAAGVKIREGRPQGAATHATRAAECFARAKDGGKLTGAGFDLDALLAIARELSIELPREAGPREARAFSVFQFRLDEIATNPAAVLADDDSIT